MDPMDKTQDADRIGKSVETPPVETPSLQSDDSQWLRHMSNKRVKRNQNRKQSQVEMAAKAHATSHSTKIIFVSEVPSAPPKKWGPWKEEKFKKGKPVDTKLTKKKLEVMDQPSIAELFVHNRTLQEFEKLKYMFHEMDGMKTENIFRISPEVQEMERAVKQCRKGNISKENFSSAHTVASVMKLWLRSLSFGRGKKFGRKSGPNKCMFGHVDNWIVTRENFFVYLEEIVASLSVEKKLVLISLLELLHDTVGQNAFNGITAKSMGVLVAPVLFDVEKLHSSPENFACIFEISENLIANYPYFLKDPLNAKRNAFKKRTLGPRVSMLRKAFMQDTMESDK